VLLCAPSLGVLDNWLPVLHAARASHPDWHIVALIPDRTTLAQLDRSDTAHVLADEVIDATVAPLVDGSWISVDGFLDAAEVPRSRRLRFGRPTRRQRALRTSIDVLNDPSNRLLFDLDLHGKARLRPLLAQLDRVPRHSMLHGVMLVDVDERATPSPRPELESAAYLFGPSEVAAYHRNFGVPSERLHVVGVPRLEPEWVEKIIERSRAIHEEPFERSVFVVSRPAGSSFLPRERKIALLRSLHEVAWHEHGLPLVLRAHPKERSDGSLTAALPARDEGRSWAISSAHPFHLAQHAEVAVTFYSGLAVDLVTLGVPTIQLLDVRGLREHDGPEASRDNQGRPCFGAYARDGLVHCAHDSDDLEALFDRLTTDRAALLAPLRQRCSELFAPSFGASTTIVSSVATDLEGSRNAPN
jgi:hypothetical protein